MDKNKIFRNIKKVDVLLEEDEILEMIDRYGRDSVLVAVREESDNLRKDVGKLEDEGEALTLIATLNQRIENNIISKYTPNMKSVINGTGTILHTNLGRAPITAEHMERLSKVVSGYSNLEYNLEEGKRGERYSHFEKLLCRLTGAEAAMAVNNNASSVLLILNALAKDKEVLVSRGEQIEIGGKFRIPDVMEASGARMVEVGTTNKTHLEDYKNSITEETGGILKVHTSNYAIVGFTESVTIDKLVELGKEQGVPVVEDLGSGVLVDLSKYGLTYEPTVQASVKEGADVVCFSGDKLLGGPQAGIIVGKKKYIDIMKKNQLTRALRIDKFTAAALELTLMEYLSEEKAVKKIPTLRMITMPLKEIETKAYKLLEDLEKEELPCRIFVRVCESQIGGGSLPMERLESRAVAIAPTEVSTALLEERLRKLSIPIIVRVVNDEIVIDLRTVDEDQIEVIVRLIKESKVMFK